MRLGFEIGQKTLGKPQSHGERMRLQRGQHAVIEAATVTQAVTPRAITHTGCKQERGDNHLGVLGLGDAISVFFHGATRVPGMKNHGFVNFVHHRQSNSAWLGLVKQFAILFPAVQGRQRIEFALDRPIGANDGIGAADQPDAHDALQKIGPL